MHEKSQRSGIGDSSLNSLREQIKQAMIPLLIKVFHWKTELSQSMSPPSLLPKALLKQPPEEVVSQLKKLDEDLHLLIQWCQSSRNQIGKALDVAAEEQKPLSTKSFAMEEKEKNTPSRWWEKLSKTFYGK